MKIDILQDCDHRLGPAQFQWFPAGTTATVPKATAEALIARGMAKPHVAAAAAKPHVAAAAAEPPTEQE